MKKLLLIIILFLFSINYSFSLLQNELSCENSGFTWLENSNYPATYSFTDDAVGSIPINWSVRDGVSAEIVKSHKGHSNVLKTESISYGAVTLPIPDYTRGVDEFWIWINEAEGASGYYNFYVSNNPGSTHADRNNFVYTLNFQIYRASLEVRAYIVGNESSSNYGLMQQGKWHHVKVEWEKNNVCLLYLDNVIVANSTCNNNIITHMHFRHLDGNTPTVYIDAVGLSWDSNYHKGDNLMGGCCGDDVIDLRKGLISNWHFDGDGLDSMGLNNAEIVGLINVSGKYGQAYDFNPPSEYSHTTYVKINDSLNLPFLGTNPWTISMWVNYDSGYSYYPQFGKGNTTSGITIHGSTGRIQGGNSINSFDYYYLFTSLSGLGWKHTVVTYDGLKFKGYVDGILTGSFNWTYGIGNTSNFPLYFGRSWMPDYYGLIDEVRLYNFALSNREVEYLYEMSPYSFINYVDTFHNGTKNVDSSYCVKNDFYTNLEQSSTACNDYGFNYLKKDWLDEGFKYRKNITITNSGTALTDYQVAINPSTYNTTGLVASYHFSEQGSSIKDYSGNNNYGTLYGSTVGLWHFDEGAGTNIYDSTVYINNGLLNNMDSATDWVNGISSSALDFDGSDDYINIPDTDKLSFTDGAGNDKPFSVSFWVKPDSFDATNGDWLINKRSSLGHEWQIFVFQGNLGFTCFGSGGGTEYITVTITNPLILNKWNYITATYNGFESASGMNIYINGILQSTTKTTSAGYAGMSNVVSDLILGKAGWEATSLRHFDGLMDELAIYNKQLSAEEVQSLYYSQKAEFIEYSEGYESKGQGLEFNGVNNFINTTSSSALTFTNNLAISLWVKFNNLGDGFGTVITKGYTGAPSTTPFMFYPASLTSLKFYVANTSNQYTSAILGSALENNKWYHFVGVYNGTHIITYKNGIQNAIAPFQGNLLENSGDLYLGYKWGSNFFNGIIDEVQIYNRSLSAQEIQDLYNERYGRLDYSDVKFYNSTGNELNYYPEYDNNFWVKVPSVPAGNSNITMYYGNPGAVSHSNGELTFVQYHGFAKTPFHDNDVIAPPFIFEASVRQTSNSEYVMWGADDSYNNMDALTAPNGDAISIMTYATGNNRYFKNWNNGVQTPPQDTPHFTLNKWYKLKIIIESSVSSKGYTSDYASPLTATTNVPWGSSMGLAMQFTSGAGEQQYSFIRKYSSTEPTSTAQSEESIYGNSKGLVAYYSFDNDVNNKTLDSINKNHGSLFGSTLALWNFDEASGSTVKDSTSYNNNGINYGTYIIENFTTVGTTIWTPPAGVTQIEVLIVAGGGGGGSTFGGGGGAGGLIYNSNYSVIPGTSYIIKVGAGGLVQANGENSSFGNLVAIGGGRSGIGSYNVGGTGGCGGGGSGFAGGGTGAAGGIGLQGYNGGAGASLPAIDGGGGGGGMGSIGETVYNVNHAGDGGNGLLYSISGTPTYYSGGGGGSGYGGGVATGGLGGGGNSGVAGTPNTGGGGGGSLTSGASGGSGIVIIKYPAYTSNSVSGQALTFDGVDDYVSISDKDYWDITGPYSVSIWFKASQIGEAYQRLVDHFTGGVPGNGWYLGLNSDNTRLSLEQRGNTGGNGVYFNSNLGFINNEWHHVVVTFNGSFATMYVDASVQATDYYYNLSHFDRVLYLGGGGTNYNLNGSIDELAIYNKSLSADEVKYLYDSKKAQFMEHVEGKIGKALEFDGINNYVDVVESNNLNIIQNLTVSGWVNPNVVNTWQRFASKGEYNTGWIVGISNTGKADITVYNGSIVTLYGLTNLSKNIWAHITGVADVTNDKIYIYVNGVLENERNFIGTINNPNFSIKIGKSGADSSYNFDGLIDEVRIYNRALSASEISELYLSQASNYGCCGDDYNKDTFYKGSLSSTYNFCYQGNFFQESIDQNKNLCEYYDYNWINNSLNYKSENSMQWGCNGTPTGFTKQTGIFELVKEEEGHLCPIYINSISTSGDTVFSEVSSAWFSFWVKLENNTQSHRVRFINGYSHVPLSIYFYNNQAMFMVGTGPWSTSKSYVPNTWYHILINFNQNAESYYYVNNVLVGSVTAQNYSVGRIDFTTAGTETLPLEWYVDSLIIADSKEEALKNFYPQSCCGDDGVNDNFYNGSIGVSRNFCNNGVLINQAIDYNQDLCTKYSYNWISQTSNISITRFFSPDKRLTTTPDENGWSSYDSAHAYSEFYNNELRLHGWIDMNDYVYNEFPTASSGKILINFKTKKATSDSRDICVAFGNDWATKKTITCISPQTSSWSNVTVEVNMNTNTYSSWINGILNENNVAFITPADSIGKFFMMTGSAAPTEDDYTSVKDLNLSKQPGYCCGDDLTNDSFYNSTLSCIKGSVCSEDLDYGLDNIYGTSDDSCGCVNEQTTCLFTQNYNYSGQCISSSCEVVYPLGTANLEIQSINYTNIYSNSLSEINIYVKNNGNGVGIINGVNFTGLNINSIDYNPNIWPGQEGLITVKTFNPCSIEGIVNNFNFTIYYADTQSKNLQSTYYEILTANPLSLIFLSNHEAYSVLQLSPSIEEKIQYFVKNNGLSNINLSVNIEQSSSIFSKVITFTGEYYPSEINLMTFNLAPSGQLFFSNQLYPIMSGQSGQYDEIIQDNNCEHNKLTLNYNYNIVSQTSTGIKVMVADETNIFELIFSLIRQIFN